MKSTELRIGNLVICDSLQTKTKHCTIGSLLENEAWVEYEYRNMYDRSIEKNTIPAPYSKLQGIELTPELLEQCGFKGPFYKSLYEIPLNNGTYDVIEVNIMNGEVNINDKQEYESSRIDFDIQMKFLHQLQNFYFALTDQELTIKELV